MRSGWFLAAGLLITTTRCTSEVAVPEAAFIGCTSNAECPEDFECNTSTERCQRVVTNSRPLVSLDILPADPRWLRGVVVRAVISDVDGDPVDLDLQFALGGAAPCPATTQTSISGLESSATGVAHDFVWTALDDAQADPTCGLRVTNVLSPVESGAPSRPCENDSLARPEVGADDDGVAVECVLALEDLSLFATPTDRAQNPSQGAQVEARDVVGDLPPIVAPRLDDESYSGLVPIEFFVIDEVTENGVGADLVDVEVEFSVDGGASWSRAAIDGPTKSLPAVPRNPNDGPDAVTPDPASGAAPFILVWNSDDPEPADGTEAGGVGASIQTAIVRMRGRTTFGDNAVIGAWVQSQPVLIENQTAPRVEDLQVLNRGSELYSGALHFSYRLVDEQSDILDVRFEYSLDDGTSFLRATEWPWILSEGSYDLASADTDLQTGGGRPHRFSWDIGSDVPFARDGVIFRARAADSFFVGSPASIAIESEVGPLESLGIDSGACFQTLDTGLNTAVVMLLDADGVAPLDLLVSESDGSGQLALGIEARANPFFGGLVDLPSSADGRSVAAGSVFGDRDDLVVRVNDTTLNLLFYDDVAQNYVVQLPAIGATSTRGMPVEIVDIDGDGDNDLVEAGDSELLVHVNPGDGTSNFATSTVPLGSVVIDFASGELTGDGIGDIAVLVREDGGGGLDEARATARLVIVSGADRSAEPETIRGELDYVFAPAARLDDQHRLILLEVVDANGDNRDDILVVEAVGDEEATPVLFARGASGWSQAPPVDDVIPEIPTRVRFADVTSDGSLDLLVFVESNRVLVFAGVSGAQPSFELRESLVLEGGDIAVAELNGDPPVDFVIANQRVEDGLVRVCITPEVGEPPENAFDNIAEEDSSVSPSGLAITDLDNDGFTDGVVAGQELYRTYVAEADGGIGLGALRLSEVPEPLSSDIGTDRPLTLRGDFNGDGTLDLFVHDADSGDAFFLQGEVLASGGAAFLDSVSATTSGLFTGDQTPGVVSDFDGDGWDEVVFLQGASILVYTASESLPVGGFGGFVLRQTLNGSLFEPRLAVTDLTGDGLMDLIAWRGDTFDFYYGQRGADEPLEDPNFGFGNAVSSVSLVTGDFDDDGSGEFAVISGTPPGLEVFGVGSDSRSIRRVSGPGMDTLPSGLGLLSSEDLDGNGALDLLGRTDDGLALLASRVIGGISSGFLQGVVFQDLDPENSAVGVGDIHADGLPDVFVVGSGVLRVGVGQRLTSRAGWTDFFSDNQIIGDGVVRAVDRFGEPTRYPVSRRRTHGRSNDPESADDFRSDFTFRLRRSGVVEPDAPAALVAITPALELRGDARVVPVQIGGGEERFRIEPRYGALSLAGGSAMQVELPIDTEQLSVVVGDPGSVRVFLFQRHWLTAADVATDPLNGEPDADTFLADRDGVLIRERGTWTRLEAGGSSGFSVDTENGRILVPLERFGSLRAYRVR